MTVIEWKMLECPGDDRHIIMYVPDTYDPDKPSAVIWALHAMTQHIDEPQFFIYPGYIQGSECFQLASYGNAIVIVPQGYNGPFLNGLGWDSSNPNPNNEDVEFFRWFIEDYLINNTVGDFGILNINRRRIYIGGYSMGGMINTCAGKISDGHHYAAMYHLAGGKFFDEPLNITRKYPAHIVIGADDTMSGDSTQILLNAYINGNHPYYYQEYSGITHMDAINANNIDPFHSPQTYFEACWDWLVQWALNEEAMLINGTTEDHGDYYKFSVVWKDADNDDPYYQMAVVVDGVYYPMQKEDPNDLNSIDGCIYTGLVSSSVLGDGFHYYYFEGIEGDQYGTYNIIEAGQGPFDISIANTSISNFTVSIIEKHPVVDFSIDKIVANVGELIQFTFIGSEGNPPSDYIWDFGDGGISTEKNPIYSYSSEGNFTVSLTVIDYDGDNDYIIKPEVIEIRLNESNSVNPNHLSISGFPLGIISTVSVLCFFGVLLKRIKDQIINKH
jgi:poly(3-hydroxybutyrate) depolymerase